MINRRSFAKCLLTSPAWLSVLSAAAADEEGKSGLDNEVDDILRRDRLLDTAAGDRFYRHPAEKPLHYDPAAIWQVAAGGMLGINHLVEEISIKPVDRTAEQTPGEITHVSVLDPAGDVVQILREFEMMRRTVGRHADKAAIVGSPDELEAANAAGKVALIPGLDTGNETGGDPLVLAELHRLGLRKMALTHEAATPFSGSNSSEPKTTPGLNPLGREMVAECNRLGVMLDVSHCSDICFWGVLACTKSPIIATHSGARGAPGLTRRNLSDEMLRALARNGGMIGIGGSTDATVYRKLWEAGEYESLARLGNWMLEHYPNRWELADTLRDKAKMREIYRKLGLPEVRSDLVDNLLNPESTLVHMDYVGRIIGFDHIGIGTDLEMYWSRYPWMVRGIAAGMLKRNYPSERIAKVFRGNFLRYFREVERTAG